MGSMRVGVLLLCVAVALAAPPQLWPLPQSVLMTDKDEYFVSLSFEFVSETGDLPLLAAAFGRYLPLLFASAPGPNSVRWLRILIFWLF